MSAEVLLDHYLSGPLWNACRVWPLAFHARLCDLRPRFLGKGTGGRGFRAVARNGRVLLASDISLSDLTGALVRVRLQTWHKAILPGDPAEPYGILVCVRTLPDADDEPLYTARLAAPSAEPFDLALEIGGGWRLEFRRPSTTPPATKASR
jgi:hypothetical protein